MFERATRRSRRRSTVGVVVSSVALVASSAIPAPAAPPGDHLPPRARIAVHAETGKVRFMGSRPGAPFAKPAGVAPGASAETVARAFLDDHGAAFGLRDQATELRILSTRRIVGGRSAVRLQQVHRGVRVLGGELIVNLQNDGHVLSAGGEISPAPFVPVAPRIAKGQAETTAKAVVAKSRDVTVDDLEATEPALWIYDSRLLGGPGLDVPILVWRMDVTGDGPIDEMVLVDARLGVVVLHFDQIAHAKDRNVCDAANTAAQLPCTSPVRTEGGPAHAVADVNQAYDFAGDTYDFFFERFGRDSLDANGMTLNSTVRYCDPSSVCPYENAFWDGAQMVYGQGFAVDDVVGHELAHGFTDYTSALFYFYQSGAINESLSDVFGEFIDLTNAAGNDADEARWSLGEDIPGIGAIRDMSDPTIFGHPDKMTSPLYHGATSDSGGVHINSGVNNKAAYLIVDGGSFNGQVITGLGIDKAALIYHEVAVNLLTSAGDYADLASGLNQACTNLVGTAGITGTDCDEVAKAVLAVEMDQVPPAAPAAEAPLCDGDTAPQDLFFDDLEDHDSGNWATSGHWYYPQNSNPFSFEATYATSGTTNLWGYDTNTTADYSITKTADVVIPPASTAYLHFRHAYMFEHGASTSYDGGVVEYSTDAGSTWNDAGPLFTHQGYNGTISGSFGNPLGARSAFVSYSRGYISSRVALSSLAGENVRFRFRIGTDSTVDDLGWFLDDIRVYRCVVPDSIPPETTILAGPTLTNIATPSFAFSADEVGSTFECRIDPAPFAPCTSPYTSDPLDDGEYTFSVQAIDAAGNTDPSPASLGFTVDTTAPDAPTITSGPKSPGRTTAVAWAFDPSELGGQMLCRLRRGATVVAALVPCTTPTSATYSLSSQPDGTFTFEVRQVDDAGSGSPFASSAYVLDRKAPAITAFKATPNPFNLRKVKKTKIGFKSSEAAVFTLVIKKRTRSIRKLALKPLASAGARSVAWNGKDQRRRLVKKGRYTAILTAIDVAGNKVVKRITIAVRR